MNFMLVTVCYVQCCKPVHPLARKHRFLRSRTSKNTLKIFEMTPHCPSSFK